MLSFVHNFLQDVDDIIRILHLNNHTYEVRLEGKKNGDYGDQTSKQQGRLCDKEFETLSFR